MQEEYFDLNTRDGLTLHGKKWSTTDAPKAIICLLHGFAEHLERYHHFAAALSLEDIYLYAIDLRGHGKSDGRRGHVKKYEYFLDDCEELLIKAREENPETPLFLMGHSMGGNIVANYALRDKSKELNGVILSCPWLRLASAPPSMKLKLAKIMIHVYPGYREASGLDTTKLSKDKEVVNAYINDPMIFSKISAGLFLSIYDAGEWALSNANLLRKPALIYHGSADEIISHDASSEFAKMAGSNAEWHSIKGGYHEPLNDIEKDQVIQLIINFIQANS